MDTDKLTEQECKDLLEVHLTAICENWDNMNKDPNPIALRYLRNIAMKLNQLTKEDKDPRCTNCRTRTAYYSSSIGKLTYRLCKACLGIVEGMPEKGREEYAIKVNLKPEK